MIPRSVGAGRGEMLDLREFASRVGPRVAKRAARLLAISAALSLLLSPTIACAQRDADSNATIESVEVIAKREALRNAIRAFVSNVTRADGENLARWRQPICPSVAGVTREQGEFVRSRILEIAATAGAPFSLDEKCRSNLLVILTPEPDQLWKGWRARFPKMFSSESAQVIEHVLAATRPVRVWHNAMLNNADGTSPITSPTKSPEYRLKDSRLMSSVAEDSVSVVVVADTTRTGSATFGQLADYVAMVSLARVDLDADFASSPTILRLFAEPSLESVSTRLTNWDQAFLKALYGTRNPLLRPRAVIATSTAQDLGP